MANEAQNKLTLRVGVVLDKDTATKEWIKLQKQVNDIQDNVMRKRKKNNDDVNDGTKEQLSLMGKLNKEAGKTVTNFLKFTVVSGIFMAITQSIRGAFQLSLELNKSWTNFNIVAKASETQLAIVDAQINDMAISLGRMKTEIIDSTTEFIRAGYDMRESMIIAKNGIMAANAGMVDMEDITKYLIAGLKSFKLEAEDSARVLDVLFSVANITAIDLEGIGEAFLRSANTLKFSGASLEESAALIAAANETIQDPAKVGTALKTIASRLRGVGEEGEIVPTLANDFKRVGVEIQNADGSFRDIYSIFSDFQKVYVNLDDLTKQSLIEKIAGKRQANILVGLLENFDLAQKSLETAYNSAGEVARANEQYVESLQGKIATLKNTVNELSQELIGGAGFKAFIELLTKVVNVINFVTSGIFGIVSGVGLFVAGVHSLNAVLLILNGTLTITTGGLNVIFGLLATALGSIVAINGVTETFGDNLEGVAQKVATLNSSISSLQGQIDGLRSKQNPTAEELEYLAVLEQRIAAEERLLEIENSKLIKGQSKESGKLLQEAYTMSQTAMELEQAGHSMREAFKAQPEAFDDLKEDVMDLESRLLSQIITYKDLQNGVDESNKSWQNAQVKVEQLETELDRLKQQYGFLGIWINTTKEVQDDATDSLQAYKDQLGGVNSYLIDAADKHDLLKSAIEQMTEKGYLTQDMINNLTDNGYGNLISALSEGKTSFINLANAMMSSNKSMIDDQINLTKKTIANIKLRMQAYQIEINRIVELARVNGASTIGAGLYAGQQTGFFEDQKAIANLENAIGLLNNKKLELIDIENRESDSKKKSTKETKKALTENERALRDINQAIAENQKLQARTTDEAKKMKLNNELIIMYQKQIKIYKAIDAELDKQAVGLKKNTVEYDEYIASIYDLSLKIEDATNSIFDLTSANETMRQSMYESVNELRDLIVDMVKQQLEDEISSYEELIKKAKEQLDLKLAQLEAEKDLADFSKDRADKEKDIAKIMSKMSSLRSAASQGDQRAINELALLEEERATKQEELDKSINDRAYELKKEGLQEQYELYEKTQKAEIDKLKANLDDASYLISRANQLMTDELLGNSDTLYTSLVKWNSVYGTGFEQDVLSKWKEAIELIKQFNSISGNTASGHSFDFGTFESGSYKDSVIAQMRKNKELWQTADAEEKKRLNQKNIGLAKSIGYSYRPSDGHYYSDTDGSRLIFDNGGFKPKGVEGYMAEGVEEWVLKDGQIKAIQEMAIMDVFSRIAKSGVNGFNMGGSGVNEYNFNVYGNINDDNVARIERNIEKFSQQVSQGQLDTFKTRGFKPSVSKR